MLNVLRLRGFWLMQVVLLNGKMRSDSLLPSIRSTAKDLRVSIITIKKTWELLESSGYIYTIPGKGSYVKENSLKVPNNIPKAIPSQINLFHKNRPEKDNSCVFF